MPRPSRIVIPEVPHHVTQRGNLQMPVFFTDADRRHYLDILQFQCSKHDVKIIGYCLMTNHVHLILIPPAENSLASIMGRTQGRYSNYINSTRQNHGHLWQERYYSFPLGESHLIHTLLYVDRNPVRAGMVQFAKDYHWSSAGAHLSCKDLSGLIYMEYWQKLAKDVDWNNLILVEEQKDTLELIRDHSKTGKPLGNVSM
jgi:putative transposase